MGSGGCPEIRAEQLVSGFLQGINPFVPHICAGLRLFLIRVWDGGALPVALGSHVTPPPYTNATQYLERPQPLGRRGGRAHVPDLAGARCQRLPCTAGARMALPCVSEPWRAKGCTGEQRLSIPKGRAPQVWQDLPAPSPALVCPCHQLRWGLQVRASSHPPAPPP